MSITETFSPAGVAALPSRRLVSPPLPAVAPGQLWLVELPGGGPLPAPARHAIDAANVVIYDRALADSLADALPLGAYAEPALGAEPAATRAVRFARDGWSVVRLLPARRAARERTRRVQDIVDELAAAKIAGRLPVTILAEAADGIEERRAVRFDELAAIVAGYPRDTRLAIVIDAFGAGSAARLHAVAANGLAG
ncbi:MAG TPA: hypothetical protein VG651_21275 [Stellaceae bacterium]|nr:hypothetical protein [Stellaceae bacterium]